jgi:hypothetical protein
MGLLMNLNKHAPIALIFFVCLSTAAIAGIDASYRDDFMRLADAIVVGFWGWMQQPRD